MELGEPVRIVSWRRERVRERERGRCWIWRGEKWRSGGVEGDEEDEEVAEEEKRGGGKKWKFEIRKRGGLAGNTCKDWKETAFEVLNIFDRSRTCDRTWGLFFFFLFWYVSI